MGSTQHRPDGLPKPRAHMANHVDNPRMGAAHEKHNSRSGFQRQTELVPKIVRDQPHFCQAQEPFRDGLHGLDPGEPGNPVDAGQNFHHTFHKCVGNSPLRQKRLVKPGGEAPVTVVADGVLFLKEPRAGENSGNRILFRQETEAPGVVVVGMAERHRVQLPQINAQLFGVVKHFITAAAVEQDAFSVAGHQQRQPVLAHQIFPPSQLVIHQSHNSHTLPPL